ncbi:hypothetical protein NIES267_37830 [Calothrix parasitica NIES-267]|uniref:Uncharacterized protein n=1 Tax=Calothrix parasitica NIES-267 TaxID=1973488 RepID=A0A1Z4LST8_9CYAN|nr:hypothetical protein NIES267_37830 [Calothrix parasitica NIES-267]
MNCCKLRYLAIARYLRDLQPNAHWGATNEKIYSEGLW